MAASLSTHVLDTGQGAPARGVRVELFREAELVAHGDTDDDGRIAGLAETLEPGRYRLVFHPPSPYFRRVELEIELGDRLRSVFERVLTLGEDLDQARPAFEELRELGFAQLPR